MKNFIESFDREFLKLHLHSCEIIRQTPAGKLFWQPGEADALFPVNSCAEYVLRSAGAIEQTFGGITAKLWDDPFEWTLPEALSDNEKILAYLAEVEAVRQRGFELFNADDDLRRELPAPEKLRPLFDILLAALARAQHFQGRAVAVFRQFSGAKLPVS